MIGSETLEAMLSAGLTGEQMLEIVRGMEADARPKDRTATERQARHREKIRAERDTVTRDVTRYEVTADPSPQSPPLKIPPDPQKITPPLTPQPDGRAVRATAHRLPDDWKPAKLSRDTVSGGIVQNRGQEWAKRTLESFKNHWRSANGPNSRKLDWQATWANWVIEQDNRDGRRQGNSGGAGAQRGPSKTLEMLRAANGAIARNREDSGGAGPAIPAEEHSG